MVIGRLRQSQNCRLRFRVRRIRSPLSSNRSSNKNKIPIH